jgi:hypothetical protein
MTELTREQKWLAAILTFYGLVLLSIVLFLVLVDTCTHGRDVHETDRAVHARIVGRDPGL